MDHVSRLKKTEFYNFQNSKIDMNIYINKFRPEQEIQFSKICAGNYTDTVDIYPAYKTYKTYILTVNMIEIYRSISFSDTIHVF